MCLKKNDSSDARQDFILFVPFQGFWNERTFIPSVCLTTAVFMLTLLHLSSQLRCNTGALPLG